ncbi:hypothetical protein RvY_17071-2 [Ramazzottius varieornatus]|uniref:Uncharacterized protein n=1 Tax=Ramazzottius varieornatus TaxID=947166 RepID=A0A1D1W0U6_RAMVA|nr:hypothetical protein RvY_17071-2 [Ramazzottius varieornatus]
MDQPFDFSSFGDDGHGARTGTSTTFASHSTAEQGAYPYHETSAGDNDWQLLNLSTSSPAHHYSHTLYSHAAEEQMPDYYQNLLTDGITGQEATVEQLIEGNEEEGEAAVEEKPMAEFASQRFKRKPRKKKVDDSRSEKKRQKRKVQDDTEESQNANEEAEQSAAVDALIADEGGGEELAAVEEEEELDESEQAAADDFYSQLLDWPATVPLNDDAVLAQSGQSMAARGLKRVRWHMEEIAFFQRCASLFNCNFNMIQDLLPHRTLAELKKQYDKQRLLYPSLYGSFSTSPRFHTVEEYYQLLDDLQKEKEDLENRMIELGVKPWSLFNAQPKVTEDQAPQSIAAGVHAEVEDEEDSNALYTLGSRPRVF